LASGVVASAAMALSAGAMTGCETIERTVRNATDAPVPFERSLFMEEPDIRVRVLGSVEKVELRGNERLLVRAAAGGTGPREIFDGPVVATVDAGGAIEVRAAAGPGGAGAGASGRAVRYGAGVGVELVAEGPGTGASRGAGVVRINGTPHAGFVTLLSRTGEPGRLDVVSTKPIEEYLPGVLVGELLKDWPLASYEAQAVAARTYALHERARARRETRAWDVENTTADQVYVGSVTSARALEATQRTRGVVVTFEGQLLRTYYHSTCGGRPGSATDVWPSGKGFEFNRAAPLRARERAHSCQLSTLYRWEVKRSVEDVSGRLRGWGHFAGNPIKDFGRFAGAEVTERNGAERPTRFEVRDDRGRKYALSAEEFRNALNYVPRPGAPLPRGLEIAPITREIRVNSGDLEVSVWEGRVTLRGRGFGHGVGLCQWCCKGMADQGKSWREMIALMYPGTRVVRGY
jgi:stage II sporulation protein D